MYDYKEAVKEDAKQAILENYDLREIFDAIEDDRDEFVEKLYDELWVNDSVTGNGSGSYYCNAYKAAESLMFNLDLLREAVEEFGGNTDVLKDGEEACDVTIRCYLLYGAIDEALEEIEDENEKQFDEWREAA